MPNSACGGEPSHNQKLPKDADCACVLLLLLQVKVVRAAQMSQMTTVREGSMEAVVVVMRVTLRMRRALMWSTCAAPSTSPS